MVGFGRKQAWLAVRDGSRDDVLAALGAQSVGTMPWRAGLDRAYTNDDLIVVTPPVAGVGGTRWTLACGRWLLANEEWIDVGRLSATLAREVQFFATYRVSELHRWERAVGGTIIRSFRYVGETGEVTDWRGDPDASELEIGLPRALDLGTDVLVSEDDVMRLAAMWSVDPTALDGLPAAGPLTAARV